jgi:hypothetical protein
MSIKMLFVVLISFFSCQKKESFTKEKLIGKWHTIDKKQPSIILEINKNIISRLENGKKIVYSSYSLSGDTLILVSTKFKEKHLIEILTDTKLRFGAVNPYQKDIELIDAVEFVKN